MTSEQIDVKRRDFDADLALCEAAGNLNWIRNLTDVDADAMFIAAARDGWLAALRRIGRVGGGGCEVARRPSTSRMRYADDHEQSLRRVDDV